MIAKICLSIFIGLSIFTSVFAEENEIYFIVPSGATSKLSRFFNDFTKDLNQKFNKKKIIFVPLQDWDIVNSEAKKLIDSGKKVIFVSEVSQTYEIEYLNIATNFNDFYKSKEYELKTLVSDIFPEYSNNSYGKNGKLYGLSIMRSIPVVYYNLDFLKKAGYNNNNLPKNWVEFKEMLKKIKETSNTIPFVLGGDWYDYLFEALVIQSGGSIMDPKSKQIKFYSAEAVKSLTFWKELIDEKLMTRVGLWKAAINGFILQKFPVIFYSSGGMGVAQKENGLNWNADMMPKDKKYGCAYGGGNLYLGKTLNIEDRDYVINFIKSLYRPEIQAEISDLSGYLPVTKKSFKVTKIKEKYTKIEAYKNVIRQVPFAHMKMMGAQNLLVRKTLKDAIDRTLDKGVPANESLKLAQKELDELEKKSH